MNSKKKGKTRIQGANEMQLRRFHNDVHKLHKRCKELNLDLCTYEEAENKDICVLSSSEYEIGTEKTFCDPNCENYFLSDEEYDTYNEAYG